MNKNTSYQAFYVGDIEYGLQEIPKGKVFLNDNRLQKQWTSLINPFLMGKHPISQQLFLKVMGYNPSAFVGLSQPVETISWIEAVEFCNQLSQQQNLDPYYKIDGDSVVSIDGNSGFRLPTEAEWQYACQAGSNTIRYADLNDIAWYKSNTSNGPEAIGQLLPNAWDLYDMLGNVWEWCSDIYDQDVYGSYRIFRGGGWNDEARSVMATTRRRSHPYKFKIDDLGFRIAKNNPKSLIEDL